MTYKILSDAAPLSFPDNASLGMSCLDSPVASHMCGLPEHVLLVYCYHT